MADPPAQLLVGSREGDQLTLRYRISEVQAICDAI